MLMPGMLTEAQMQQLDQAKGPEFDRLFLTYMIQHHRGAVSMVKELFGTDGAAQDEAVFKFANDVSVDQSTEIARMETHARRPQPREMKPSAVCPKHHRSPIRNPAWHPPASLSLALGLVSLAACAHSASRRRIRAPRQARPPRRPARIRGSACAPGLMMPARPPGTCGCCRKTPPSEQFVGQHQLRPGLHRPLRHPGQLQRLPGVGHRQSQPARR